MILCIPASVKTKAGIHTFFVKLPLGWRESIIPKSHNQKEPLKSPGPWADWILNLHNPDHKALLQYSRSDYSHKGLLYFRGDNKVNRLQGSFWRVFHQEQLPILFLLQSHNLCLCGYCLALRDQYNFEYGEDRMVNGQFVNDKCRSLAKKIKEIIDTKSSFADWLNNQIVRDQLKFDIKVCLIKNGYPPQYSPEVFRKVMEQVENFEENSWI